MSRRGLFPCFLFLLFALANISKAQSNAVDVDLCYSSLIAADEDGDRKLDADEYFTFAEILGFENVCGEEYVDLPLSLRGTFLFLSCQCASSGSTNGQSCCLGTNAYLPTNGAGILETPTTQQINYLHQVCQRTYNVLQEIPVVSCPTSSPTSKPTSSPTLKPTSTPTNSPTKKPTIAPTAQPTTPPGSPTPSPTAKPTPMPTITGKPTTDNGGVDAVIRTVYSISVINGKRDNVQSYIYTPDLVNAMNIVASDVAVLVEQEAVKESLNSNRRRRKLAVTVKLPTSVVLIQDAEWLDDDIGAPSCSSELGNPDTDRCEEVTAAVELFLEDEDEASVSTTFKSILDEKISDGSLQEALESVNSVATVKILTGMEISDDDEVNGTSPKKKKLSGGATAAIVVVVLASIAIVSLLVVRNGKKATGAFVASELASGLEAPSTGKFPDEKSDGGVSKEDSAGWSDAYSNSSMGTKEENLLDLGNTTPSESTKLEDLEAAISTGDWAAVGASAALLAASQYETGSLTNSKTSVSIYSKESSAPSLQKKDLNSEKAQELDQLINNGDWEGVIQAAARYEAEFNQESGSASVFEDSDSREGSLNSGSAEFSSSLNQTTITSTSGTNPSSATPPNQEEFRQEVETMVRKVVPEELENVDEMISQFKGRENELLETLRSMQERDVANKAKLAEQQKAKLGAKMAVRKRKSEQDRNGATQTSAEAGAEAAANWAIARAMASLEQKENDMDDNSDDNSNFINESLPDDEGSL